MASFNKSIVVGTLGQDPQVKFLTGGTAVCEISLACNRTWKDKSSGEKKEACDWIPVVLWGRLAEIVGEYLRKGSSCLIEGRLELSTWEKDGQKHSRLKVVAENMTMLGSKGGNRSRDEQQSPEESSQVPPESHDSTPEPDDSSVPF